MKNVLIAILIVLLPLSIAFSQETPQTEETTPVAEKPAPEEIKLGRIYFPRNFIHADKTYTKGVYRVKLTISGEESHFTVANRKNELLFNELAVIKPNTGKYKKFRYRLKKEMLRGYEYFRIRVTKPDNYYFAYFFIKPESAETPPPAAEGSKEADQ